MSGQSEQMNFMEIFASFPQMIAGIFGMLDPIVEDAFDDESIHCPSCGSSFNDLKDTGRLGCDSCYSAFSEKLEPILRKIHGSSEHFGKIPSSSSRKTKNKAKLKSLKNELNQLVKKEAFEQAALIRDEIKKLESSIPRQLTK
jgi:protein arginine kinase activator